MDESVLQQITEWLTKIAAAGITILPLIFLVGLVKSIQQLDNLVGNMVNKGKKSAEGVGGNIKSRRDIAAANGTGLWGRTPLGSGRRRAMRRRAKSGALESQAKHAAEHYVNKEIQKDGRFAKQVAGGLPTLQALSKGMAGAPRAEDLQRVLAGAKFKIEQVEIEDIKAAHATIDLENEQGLMDKINNTSTSHTTRAAALERLVQVGSMKNIASAVKDYGDKGESTESRALAGALQKDGPGFLKASDIDNIRRGKLGASEPDGQGGTRTIAGDLDQITADNLASGVFSAKKIVAASNPELEYASKIAESMALQGDGRAVQKLQESAKEVIGNPTLSGDLKHNRAYVDSMSKNGTI